MASSAFTESNWSGYVPITSDNTLVDNANGNLVFSTGIHGSLPSDFWSNVAADGSDLRVVNSAGDTAYSFEIEEIDTTAETLTVFFDSQNLATGSDVEWRLYAGNGSATAPAEGDTLGKHNVWNSDHAAVYHMAENPSSSNILDSTSNSRDMTPTNLVSGDLVSAQLGDGIDFESGNSEELSAGDVADIGTDDIVVSAWVNYDSLTSGHIFGKGSFDESDAGFMLYQGGGDNPTMLVMDESGNNYVARPSDNALSTNTWFYMVGVADRDGNAEIYLDATSKDTVDISGFSAENLATGRPLVIGYHDSPSNNDYMDGTVDEVRYRKGSGIASTYDSNYVTTEYNNQSNASFFTVGSWNSLGIGRRVFNIT